MLVEECDELDAKIAWKLSETNNQLESLSDLNEHITLLRPLKIFSRRSMLSDKPTPVKALLVTMWISA